MDWVEQSDGGEDRNPEDHNFEEGEIRTVQPKKSGVQAAFSNSCKAKISNGNAAPAMKGQALVSSASSGSDASRGRGRAGGPSPLSTGRQLAEQRRFTRPNRVLSGCSRPCCKNWACLPTSIRPAPSGASPTAARRMATTTTRTILGSRPYLRICVSWTTSASTCCRKSQAAL